MRLLYNASSVQPVDAVKVVIDDTLEMYA